MTLADFVKTDPQLWRVISDWGSPTEASRLTDKVLARLLGRISACTRTAVLSLRHCKGVDGSGILPLTVRSDSFPRRVHDDIWQGHALALEEIDLRTGGVTLATATIARVLKSLLPLTAEADTGQKLRAIRFAWNMDPFGHLLELTGNWDQPAGRIELVLRRREGNTLITCGLDGCSKSPYDPNRCAQCARHSCCLECN